MFLTLKNLRRAMLACPDEASGSTRIVVTF